MNSEDLHARRVAAVRAWTRFVERGDDADAVRPEILRSWELSRRRHRPTSPTRRSTTRATRPTSGRPPRSQPRCRRVAGRAAAHRRGRRPRHRGHRRRDPDPVDLRRPGDAPQGRVGELRARRALGRGERRHQRARHRGRTGTPSMVFSAEHYAEIVHNWVCWAAPVHDPVTGRQLGVIDLSTTWDRTHPIGLATARVMARLIESALPRSTVVRRRPGTARRRARPDHDPARHRADLARRPAAAPQPATDRDPRPAGAAPRGALGRAPARPALRRPRRHHLHAQGRGVAPAQRASAASSPRAPTGSPCPWPPTSTRCSRLLRRGDVARGRRGPTAGTCCPAPTRRRWSSWPTTSPSPARGPAGDPQPDAVLRYSELAPYDTAVVEACLGRAARHHPAKALLKGRLAASAVTPPILG